MKVGIVYKITNLVTKKVYIGSTTNSLKERWRQHLVDVKRGATRLLAKSIRKHGYNNFTIEEYCTVLYNHENIAELENQLIYFHNALYEDGYNMIPSQNNEDLRRIKSEQMKEEWANNPERQKVRVNLSNIGKSEENKKARLEGSRIYYDNPENSQKISAHAKSLWESGKIDKTEHYERLKERWSRPGEKERASVSGKLANMNRQLPIAAVNIYYGNVVYFNCVHDAIRFGFSASSITESLKGRVKTGQDHVWFYKTTEDLEFYKNEAIKRLGHSFKNEFTRPIEGVNIETGEVIKFDSTLELDSDFKPKEVIRVLRGHRKTAHGYYWKFA